MMAHLGLFLGRSHDIKQFLARMHIELGVNMSHMGLYGIA